ncbi:hypothetical protein [Hyalangium gracile]|uniref:hypothetical protein n=1 Tax=Hyalangium gracile TaxID=394092 RepID=UPI001CCF06D5|nr:hypothetical protein [Hyalangium gracile]
MTQVNLEHMTLVQEELEFGSKVILFLGPDLTLSDCTLVLGMASRDLVIPQARFIDCTFIFKKPLRDFRWETAHLQGCRFKGHLIGNDFGELPYAPGKGSIVDCDFSEARLHGCRFLACDVNSLRLPRWPCFTIFDPVSRGRELSALSWPSRIGPVVVQGFAESPVPMVAVTYSAPELAKRYDTTPEAIRAVIEKLDGVYY